MNTPTGPSSPSRALARYLAVVVAVGTLALVRATVEAVATPHPVAWLSLCAVTLACAWFRVNFKTVSATQGVEDTFCFTSTLLFGPGPATLALAGHSIVHSLRRRRPLRQITFNAASLGLSMWASAHAFYALSGVAPLAMSRTPISNVVLGARVLSCSPSASQFPVLLNPRGSSSPGCPSRAWTTHRDLQRAIDDAPSSTPLRALDHRRRRPSSLPALPRAPPRT